MRALRAWLVYLALVFVGGALLAPWLHALAVTAATRLPGLHGLAEQPFHRFVNRSILVLAIVGLWPLTRFLGFRSGRDLGWCAPARNWRSLATGFGLGFASLALAGAAAIGGGGRLWHADRSAEEFAAQALSAAVTAGLVATIEETLFRGALHGSLRRELSLPAALALSSGVYAWVHFFARVRWEGAIEWTTGVIVLGQMLRGFVEIEALVPGFLNLALAGALLGLAFERTGNLYLAIGLHAGWIFWLKFYGFATTPAGGANAWFWGSSRLIDGWLAFVALALVTPVVLRAAHRPAQPPNKRAK